MTSYKPDPDFGPGGFIEDPAPIRSQGFVQANELNSFIFDEDFTPRIDCPDCGKYCQPASLGEAVDWALGHECKPEWETVTEAGKD